MKNKLQQELVISGKYGRSSNKKIERYDDLDPEIGVNRAEGTEANLQLRQFTVECMNDAELEVSFDKFGNIFGRKEGSKVGKKAIMCGSHLDSVVNGGQFDGALGVFSGIDAVRRLKKQGFINDRPIEIVAFSGEEGSAFDISLLGSAALTGEISCDEALSTRNAADRTFGDILKENGYHGDDERDLNDFEYFLELHIEQGPVLFSEKIPIGIVEKITGNTWLFATVQGIENHAGTTPINMRKDALVASAEVVTFVRERTKKMAVKRDAPTVGTVGRFNVFPNGINIVPGKVELGIDIRDVSLKNMEDLKSEVIEFLEGLGNRFGVKVAIKNNTIDLPVQLSPEVIDVIESSAQKKDIAYRKIHSMAGHDAQNMAKRLKTGMIFVPSINGISHSPLEWTNWEDIEKGAEILAETLKMLSNK